MSDRYEIFRTHVVAALAAADEWRALPSRTPESRANFLEIDRCLIRFLETEFLPNVGDENVRAKNHAEWKLSITSRPVDFTNIDELRAIDPDIFFMKFMRYSISQYKMPHDTSKLTDWYVLSVIHKPLIDISYVTDESIRDAVLVYDMIKAGSPMEDIAAIFERKAQEKMVSTVPTSRKPSHPQITAHDARVALDQIVTVHEFFDVENPVNDRRLTYSVLRHDYHLFVGNQNIWTGKFMDDAVRRYNSD